MRRCDNTIKIYVKKELQEIPCFVETFQQGIEEGRYIITAKGNLKINVQNNNITDKIREDKRIIKWDYGWKVIAKKAEHKGLRYILFEEDATNSAYNDIENEIADIWEYQVKHTYNMTVTEDNIILKEGQTKQLIVNVKDTIDGKTENVINPTIIYASADLVKYYILNSIKN